MIRITIEKITPVIWTETQHKLLKSTPTEIREMDDSYGGGRKEKVKCVEEYGPVEVSCKDTKRQALLTQEIENDEAFNLAAVIATINGISVSPQIG